jgi:hypothetical protein
MSNHQNGKGSKPRPVNKKVYNSNFDDINWGIRSKKLRLQTIDDFCGNPDGTFQENLKKQQEIETQSWSNLKKKIKKG